MSPVLEFLVCLLFICVFVFVTSAGLLVVVCFLFSWLGNWSFRSVRGRTFILDNMILYEKKISILIVIADLE